MLSPIEQLEIRLAGIEEEQITIGMQINDVKVRIQELKESR